MIRSDSAMTRLGEPYRISHWPVLLLGYGSGGFFTALFLLAMSAHQQQATLLCLPWMFLGFYLGLRTGTTILTATHVSHLCPLGRYTIAWSRVTHIEYDQQGNCVILHAPQQRLVLPGTHFWMGNQRQAALHAMDQLVRQYAIQMHESMSAPYKISKNTRQS